MANKLETTQVTFNDEKIACARFTIDDISVPFVLKNIAVTGKDYTFSLYLKSNGDSSISVEGNNITSTTAWTRQYVTFSATKANVEISFNKTGTYYFYNTQLETGKICSDWTPNPEDISEDVLNAETIAKQTATKFSWLVKSGTSESNFELTDRTISLISKNINLNGIVTFMNTAKGEVYKNLYASTGYADFESIKSTDEAICYAKLDSNSVAIDSSTYWQGSNSLKISGTAKDRVRVYLGNKENNYGCIKVEQGKTYQITAYVKSDSEQNVSFGIDWITHGTKIDAATGTCYIESYLFNPQKPSFPKGCTTITPNTSWQRAITTFTVIDKTNSYYYISIVPTIYNQLSKNANFWVDGIMVEEVESLNSEPNEFTNSTKATIIDGNSILTDSITADKLTANSITAEKIMADALKSKNYVVGESGSFLNLADGSFDSKYLKWDSVGKITASMGKIANWNINSTSIYKGDGWKSSTSGSAYFGDNGLSITDKFLVDKNGVLMASDSILGGNVYLSDGNKNIGRLDIGTYNGVKGTALVSLIDGGYSALGNYNSSDNTVYIAAYAKNKKFYVPSDFYVSNLVANDGTIYVSSQMFVSKPIDTNNNTYIFTRTKENYKVSLIGWSISNNIWIGDYGYGEVRTPASNAFITANNVYKTTSGGNTSLSDERYKHGFKDIPDAFDFIMNLNPCLFKFDDGTSDRYHMGFKAQEVENNMLNTIGDTGLTVKYNFEEGLDVDLDNSDTYILGLRYEEFIAPLIQVVQNQQKQIQDLEKKIAILSN